MDVGPAQDHLPAFFSGGVTPGATGGPFQPLEFVASGVPQGLGEVMGPGPACQVKKLPEFPGVHCFHAPGAGGRPPRRQPPCACRRWGRRYGRSRRNPGSTWDWRAPGGWVLAPGGITLGGIGGVALTGAGVGSGLAATGGGGLGAGISAGVGEAAGSAGSSLAGQGRSGFVIRGQGRSGPVCRRGKAGHVLKQFLTYQIHYR